MDFVARSPSGLGQFNLGGTASTVTGDMLVGRASTVDGLGQWARGFTSTPGINPFWNDVYPIVSFRDSFGDLYVGGTFGGFLTFGTSVLYSEGTNKDFDAFVVKLDGASGNVIWARQFFWYDGADPNDVYNNSDVATDITMDAQGRLVVAFASSWSGADYPAIERLNPTNGSTIDAPWPASLTTSIYTRITAVVADGPGALVAGRCGTSSGCSGTHTGCPPPTTTAPYRFVARFNSSFQCTQLQELPFAFEVNDMVQLPGGDLILAGSNDGVSTLGGTTHTTQGQDDILVARLNTALSVVWSEQYGGFGKDAVQGLSLDANGNILLSGYFSSVATLGSGQSTSLGATDAFLTQLTPTGVHVATTIIASSGYDRCIFQAVGPEMYTACYTTGPLDLGWGLHPASGNDLVYGRLPP